MCVYIVDYFICRHPSVGTSDSEDDPGRKHPTTGQRSGALSSRYRTFNFYISLMFFGLEVLV